MSRVIPLRSGAATDTKMIRCSRGSITVEAACSLSILLFCMLILLTPMLALRQQLHTTVVLERNARQLAKWKYLEYYGKRTGRLKLSSETVSAAETGLSILKVWQELQTEGMKRLDLLSESRIGEEEILLVLNYAVNIPFPFLHRKGFTGQVVASRRAWIGARPYRFSEEDEEGEEQLVYIGSRSDAVYHTDRNCSYLRSSFQSGSAAELANMRNRFGERYQPCHCCKPEKDAALVYFTEGGKRFHSASSCPAMQSHPHIITLKQAIAEGRHGCCRCAA